MPEIQTVGCCITPGMPFHVRRQGLRICCFRSDCLALWAGHHRCANQRVQPGGLNTPLHAFSPPSHPPLPPSFISSFFSFFLLLFVPPSPFCLPLFPRHLPILPLFSSSSLIYSPLRCATSRSRGKVLWQPGSRSARRSTASSRSCCHFALARHSYPGMTSLRRWRLGSRGLRTARRCGSHLRISHAREHRRLNVERLLLLLFFFLPFSFFPFFFASLPSFTLRHILRTLTS